MQAWDAVLIKAESNHPKKGRAGVVQSVDLNRITGEVNTVTIRLDETAKGETVEVVTADAKDVQRLSA